jgi:hypothetical protein
MNCPRCEEPILVGEVCAITDEDELVHADHLPETTDLKMFFYWSTEQVEQIRRNRPNPPANSGDN